jgi:tripartite ATP-independent transporter DctP family solute receptor
MAKSAFLVVALCALASAAAATESPRILKIGYILQQESQLGAGATVFAREVEQRTHGRYVIEPYPDAQLGGEVEMVQAVQLGTIDIAFVTAAPLPNFVPQVGVFGIPFLVRDAAAAHALLDGPFGVKLLKQFADKNLVALAWGENGMRHLTNSKHPIQVPDDFRGLKLRVPQNDTMVTGFKAFGAEVSQLPFPDLYGALQSGRFDGQENPIATILSSRFSQVQSHLTLSGHIYDPAVFLIARDLYNEDLSAADKQAFVEAARLGGLESRRYAAEAEASGVAKLEADGMKVVRSIDKAKFAARMAPVMPVFEQKFGTEAVAAVSNESLARH